MRKESYRPGSDPITAGDSASSPAINNVTATATGGTANYGVENNSSSSPTIKGSTITGSLNSIYNSSASATAVVSGSTLKGGPVSGVGFTCHFNISGGGSALADVTCA